LELALFEKLNALGQSAGVVAVYAALGVLRELVRRRLVPLGLGLSVELQPCALQVRLLRARNGLVPRVLHRFAVLEPLKELLLLPLHLERLLVGLLLLFVVAAVEPVVHFGLLLLRLLVDDLHAIVGQREVALLHAVKELDKLAIFPLVAAGDERL